MEELTRGVQRLGLAHQEEVGSRREQEQRVVGEAAAETAALAHSRDLLHQRLVGARGQGDANRVRLEEVNEEVKVSKETVKDQNGQEEMKKKEEAKLKVEEETLEEAVKKNKKEKDDLVKGRNNYEESKRKLAKEEKVVADEKMMLRKFLETDEKLVKEKEVRDDEVADLISTAEAHERLVAAAARRLEEREQELVTLRPAAAIFIIW